MPLESKGEVMAEPKPFDWEASGAYNQDDAKETNFARVLVVGPGKQGKTTALVTTAPGPVFVINCDGDSALKFPRGEMGAQFHAVDVKGRASLKKALKLAEDAVKAKAVKSVILDSASLLADSLMIELQGTLDGFALWDEFGAQLGGAIRRMCDLEAHAFVTAHLIPGHEKEGILPMLPGQMKHKIITIMHDAVRFEYNAERNPTRQFLIGPNKDWSYAGRNVKRTISVPATVPALLGELGVKL